MSSSVNAIPSPTGWKVWWMAFRPRTLLAGVTPVVLGQALAIREGQGSAALFVVSFFWMMLLQIGCNLHNDYFDFKQGADTEERVGPVRVTQSGLISARTVLVVSLSFFGGGALLGAYLTHLGGTPALWMSLIVMFGLYAYSGGPFPLSYHALGEVVVFTCFGLFPTLLTYYVQTLHLDGSVWLVALVPSLMAAAILCVNNLRDVVTDGKSGKNTTIVRVGTRVGKAMYLTCIVGTVLLPVVLCVLGKFGPTILLSLLALPMIREPMRRVFKETGAPLNAALGGTAKFEGVFGLLMAIGLVLDKTPLS